MKKQILIGGLGLLGFFGSFLVLFWGPSFRMAQANQALAVYEISKAQQLYQTLGKSFPKLPQVSYNQGLCYYQLGEYQGARRSFEQAMRNMEASSKKSNPRESKVLLGSIQYQLANVAFKSTSAAKDEPAKLKLYQDALAYYKKALQANPGDMEAKTNYELVLLRLNHSNQGGAAAEQPSEALKQSASQSEEYLNQSTPSELMPEGNDW